MQLIQLFKQISMKGQKEIIKPIASMEERYKATMLLAAVGDAMGYKNGHWEFIFEGAKIHEEMLKITQGKGISKLKIQPKHFRYSDDTVMHIATAKGLVQCSPKDSADSICLKIAVQYKICMNFMSGRAPGNTCIRSIKLLNQKCTNWNQNPYVKNGGGCGAAMRAACIGLYFHNDIDKLIQISIQTGRTTHHNPLGYLGSMVAAYFTALAIQGKHPNEWLSMLITEGLPKSMEYIKKSGRDVDSNINGGDWKTFYKCWKNYAQERCMEQQKPSVPIFPENYSVHQREIFYHKISLNGWPGALGVDSVIIAYDALLGCNQNWEELCLRGMLHGGDNDSTGTIAGAWFGAIYGYKNIPADNKDYSEDKELIQRLGRDIYQIVRLE